MSIEQTNQLILLILNSALMMLLSAALLGGAWLRQNMLSQQLRQIRRRYRAMTQAMEPSNSAEATLVEKIAEKNTSLQANLKKIRSDRQRLRYQYRWSHSGMLTLHMVLLVFSVNLLALSLRSLLSFDSLISTALILFALGAAGLLAGAGCILVDLWQGNGSRDASGHSIGQALAQMGQTWPKKKLRPAWIEAWKAGR